MKNLKLAHVVSDEIYGQLRVHMIQENTKWSIKEIMQYIKMQTLYHL